MRSPHATLGVVGALVLSLSMPVTAMADDGETLELSALTELADSAERAKYETLTARVLHPTNYRHRHRRGRIIRLRPPPRRRHHRRSVRRSNRRTSLYFGIGGLGNFFLEGGDDASKVYRGGGGFDLMVGVRLSDFIGLEVNYFAAFQSTAKSSTGAEIADGMLQAISVDGKIYFLGARSSLQPFAQIGIGAYFLSETFKERLTGFGLDLGGGVDIKLGSMFAIGLRLLYRGFYVDNSEASYSKIATESAFLNTITAEANAQFHF